MKARFALFLQWMLLLLCLTVPVGAETLLKPYILSSHVKGDFVKTIIEVKEALVSAGFELAGEYTPFENAHVIVVTNEMLKEAGASDQGAAYAMGLRVSVTRVEDLVQVAYADPQYYHHAYGLNQDLTPVYEELYSTLGRMEHFGSSGMSESSLRDYRYATGTEQFNDQLKLAVYADYESAIRAFEQGLDAGTGEISLVYRIDQPEAEVSLFGIGILAGEASDKVIAETLDVGAFRHTARLPYEVLVWGGEVFALHPRFRIPVDFPNMERVGKHSFMQLHKVPGLIEQQLKALANPYREPVGE